MKLDHIYQGNALEILKKFPEKSIDCCVTSPPYYGLRKYNTDPVKWDDGTECELGWEPHPDIYVKHLCHIFNEIFRILTDIGTLWVNIADSYSGSGGAGGDWNKGKRKECDKWIPPKTNIKDRSLMRIPERFVIEMENRGWIAINTIIWEKPNCPVGPYYKRFTVNFEYIYLFVKSNKTQFYVNPVKKLVKKNKTPDKDWVENIDFKYKINEKNKKIKSSFWKGYEYFFEQQFEKNAQSTIERGKYTWSRKGTKSHDYPNGLNHDKLFPVNLLGRNMRCVWKISPAKSSKNHFAVWPKKLVKKMLDPGCPLKVCKSCGLPVIKGYIDDQFVEAPPFGGTHKQEEFSKSNPMYSGNSGYYSKKFNGYCSCNCNCENKSIRKGIVLDPFMGSGTTAIVAKTMGLDYVGCELSPENIKISNEGIKEEAPNHVLTEYSIT